MSVPGDWVLIPLTGAQQAHATEVGRARHTRPRTANRTPTTVGQHILGALGEAAVAAYLGIAYDPPPDLAAEMAADVGRWQVRTRPHSDWGLGLHNGDRTKQWFMLALGHDAPGAIWLAGYIHAREGFRVATHRTDGNWLGDPNWWLVDQAGLLPVPERGQWISLAHIRGATLTS